MSIEHTNNHTVCKVTIELNVLCKSRTVTFNIIFSVLAMTMLTHSSCYFDDLLPIVADGFDDEFEVTAEMLIHGTMDDETTMELEEALQTKEEDAEELCGLQEVVLNTDCILHVHKGLFHM